MVAEQIAKQNNILCFPNILQAKSSQVSNTCPLNEFYFLYYLGLGMKMLIVVWDLEKGLFSSTLGLWDSRVEWMSQKLHTPVIHSFSSRRYGYRGELSRQGPHLSPEGGTTAQPPSARIQAGFLTTILGRVFPPVPGAPSPSSYSIFPPYLGLPGRGSPRWRQSLPVPGKCRVGGCPHPSPRSTKDTRWQTLLIHPSLAGNQHRLHAWSGPSFPDISASLANLWGCHPFCTQNATQGEVFPHLDRATAELILSNAFTSVHSSALWITPLTLLPKRPPPRHPLSLLFPQLATFFPLFLALFPTPRAPSDSGLHSSVQIPAALLLPDPRASPSPPSVPGI